MARQAINLPSTERCRITRRTRRGVTVTSIITTPASLTELAGVLVQRGVDPRDQLTLEPVTRDSDGKYQRENFDSLRFNYDH